VSRTSSLRDFIGQVRATKRLSFGDLRRLQRDILPGRIATLEEAELLISLDRAVERADADWSDYLTVAVRDFVVWGLPPIGVVDRDKAEWLAATLPSCDSKTARQIAREVAREACDVDEALLKFLGASRPPRSRDVRSQVATF
jgi:hypothetical protein